MKNSDPKPVTLPGQFLVIEDDHSGRDEMNLAGNPFALLQAAGKSQNGGAHLKCEWERRLPSGRIAKASWEVSGHAELGLPGPADELLYLVLLEMTREAAVDGVWPQQVHFSRAALLKRLGWADTKKYYQLLADCFKRLDAVTIQAQNAFYDARTRAVLPLISFSITDGAQIADEPRGLKSPDAALPRSFWKWSDRMLESFNSGNVRSLALDFVISLECPTAVRLFRYLDMHRNAHKPALGEFTIGLSKLRDHLGIVSVSYPSQVKQKLEPAHLELQNRGYLAEVEYRKGKGSELVIYSFGGGVKPLETPIAAAAGANLSPKTPGNAVSGAVCAPDESIYPNEAYGVFTGLEEAEKGRLRDMARQQVEPAFWDRLENPGSPMALVLWEIVAREFPALYAAALELPAPETASETAPGASSIAEGVSPRARRK